MTRSSLRGFTLVTRSFCEAAPSTPRLGPSAPSYGYLSKPSAISGDSSLGRLSFYYLWRWNLVGLSDLWEKEKDCALDMELPLLELLFTLMMIFWLDCLSGLSLMLEDLLLVSSFSDT